MDVTICAYMSNAGAQVGPLASGSRHVESRDLLGVADCYSL